METNEEATNITNSKEVIVQGVVLGRIHCMEVIWLSEYDFLEKVAIVEQYLVPKSMQESGLIVLKKDLS